jgi:glucose/mannose-6-phosphate isomerase
MEEAIRNFPQQFLYDPVIEDGPAPSVSSYIIAGMGGSHLAGDLLKMLRPEAPIVIHPDYGLPRMSEETLRDSLIIGSSYSGDTEEPIDTFEEAKKKDLAFAVIATGGRLWELAQAARVPRIRMPDTGIQPRMALGFSLKALLKLLGDEEGLKASAALSSELDVGAAEKEGERIADLLAGRTPVIYASAQNIAIAYNWKIKFNETGKTPAFYNMFPELNHNEMTGFDCGPKAKRPGDQYAVLMITDDRDDERVRKRMEITAELYKERGIHVEMLPLSGETLLKKAFQSLMIADWAAYHTARACGAEPEQVPMVEELKRRIMNQESRIKNHGVRSI